MGAVKHYLLKDDFMDENEAMDGMNECMEELHFRTVEILVKLVDVLNCDDLALLCYHCGVNVNELMPVMVAQTMKREIPSAYIFGEI
jgi:hypothetical protein